MKNLFKKLTLLILVISMVIFAIACDGESEDIVQVTGTFNYQIMTGTRTNDSGDEESYQYYKITGYQVSKEDTLKIEEGKFDEIDTKYREIIIPETYKGLPVEEIDASAFANQLILTKVGIKNNIKTIGAGAFSGCTNLEHLDIPFVGKSADATNSERLFGHLFGSGATNEGNTDITAKIHARKNSVDGSDIIAGEDVTFKVPTSLKSVRVTEAEIITECAFYGMTTLKSIVFEKATEIESHAFYGCTSLQQFDLSKIKNIYQYAFAGCNSLKKVNFDEAEVLELIDDKAFSGCVYLQSNSVSDDEELLTLKFSDAIKEIRRGAFADCSQIKYLDLTNVEKVEDVAFSGCFSLKKVTLNNGAVYGDSVFKDCTSLKEEGIINKENIDVNKLLGKTNN